MGLSKHYKSIIAATAWLIWKSRCDVIFRNASINIPVIACRALSHVQDFCASNRCLLGQKLILNNFTCADELFLFSHSSSNPDTSVCSAGFFLSNSNYVVHLAGYCPISRNDSSLDEFSALFAALQSVLVNRLNIKHIFVNTSTIPSILCRPNPVTMWRFCSQLANIRSLLTALGSPSIHCIPLTWMTPAINLAAHGINSSDENLFLFGRDLPHWIMKSFLDSGFIV